MFDGYLNFWEHITLRLYQRAGIFWFCGECCC